MKFQEVMTPAAASEEISNWLDAKRVAPKKRESYDQAIETLTDALTYGTISIREDMTIEHKLHFPPDPSITTLEYKPRLTVFEIQSRMKSVKAGDADGRINATVAALTGQNTGILQKLDSEDNSIAQAVAVFFL